PAEAGDHPGRVDRDPHDAAPRQGVSDYASFLQRKRAAAPAIGREVTSLHPSLFPHQRQVVEWAARRGRAAVFLDTGLGKTRVATEWARSMADTSLTIAPLSIARQTVREAAALDVEMRYVRSGDEITAPGHYVTNYEMQDRFDPSGF